MGAGCASPPKKGRGVTALQQARKTGGILSPRMKAEMEEKRRFAGAMWAGAAAPQADSTGRRKIKPAEVKEGGLAAREAPAANPVPVKKEPCEQRCRRVTSYLGKSLHARVQELRRSGWVTSVTALYNAVLREFTGRRYIMQ